ncbi:MAG: hypothetical protein RRC34_04875 [Lentisphaeria bacterium]|nr:hypothetical protein [Lentisphaeria bacterium]
MNKTSTIGQMIRIMFCIPLCWQFICASVFAQEMTMPEPEVPGGVMGEEHPLKAGLHETYNVIRNLGDGKSLVPKISRTLSIKDLGAVGDGKTDDGPAFRKAMEIISESNGNVQLLLEPNRKYRILSTSGVSYDGKSLKTRNPHVISISDAENVIIDGQGSTLILTWPVKFNSVDQSANVWIGNLTMTYDPFPCAQTRIVAKQPELKAIDVQLEQGYSPPNFDPPGETANHGKWAFSWGIKPNCHFWIKHIKEIDPESSKKGVFRIFPQDSAEKSIGGLKIGQRMLVPVLRNGARTSGTHSRITGNRNVILYKVITHAANEFSYLVAYNQGMVVIKKCEIRPVTPEGASSPSVFASWRDGFHTKTNRGPVVFEECYFDGLYDDDINISHITLAMEKIIDPKTYRIRVLIGEGFPEIRIGDTVEAWNYETGKNCGTAKILKVAPGDSPGTENGRKYWNMIITVDRPLKNIEGGESGRTLSGSKDAKVLLSIREYHNWAIVRNCYFHGTVRFRSPGIYENNTFKGWMWVTERFRGGSPVECPLPQHQMFRNNVFGPVPSGNARLISYEPLVHKDLPSENIDILGRDITYINNTIHRQLVFRNAQGITLVGNHLITRNKVPPVLIENCKYIKIGPGRIDEREWSADQMQQFFSIVNTPETELETFSSGGEKVNMNKRTTRDN